MKVVREAPRQETLAAAHGRRGPLLKSHFFRGFVAGTHTLSLSSHPTWRRKLLSHNLITNHLSISKKLLS